MTALSASRTLALPVGVRSIRLGVPVDLLLARDEWRVIGFDVRCGDEANRFLAWAAATVDVDRISVGSALTLLDDIGFYRARTRSFRELLGSQVWADASLSDLLLGADGVVLELVADEDGEELRRGPDDDRLATGGGRGSW